MKNSGVRNMGGVGEDEGGGNGDAAWQVTVYDGESMCLLGFGEE